jgi:hypothetical protein
MGELTATLAKAGYAFVPAAATRAELASAGPLDDWNGFSGSWNDLAVDTYLADHGRYRRRRHAVFTLRADGAATREPHQPHFQSRVYNPLQGGIERWFEPIQPAVADGDTFRSILRWCARTFGPLAPGIAAWRTEVHQFRIEARAGQPGQPTPEGVHRDGVDFVLVLLVARENIAQGTTTIHTAEGRLLGDFTLATPLDAALVDDHRIHHGVTPVVAIDAARPAFRDVLVVTLAAPGTRR